MEDRQNTNDIMKKEVNSNCGEVEENEYYPKNMFLQERILSKLTEVSRDLRSMADLLDGIVEVRKVTEEDIKQLHPETQTKVYPAQKLSQMAFNNSGLDLFKRIVDAQLLKNGLTTEDIQQLYVAQEPSGIALMRDILDIPEDKFIDYGCANDTMIWDIISDIVDERELTILGIKYGRYGRLKRFLRCAAKELNVTGSRVGQLYARARRKVESAFRRIEYLDRLTMALFGINATKMANTVYTLSNFMMIRSSNSEGNENCTFAPARTVSSIEQTTPSAPDTGVDTTTLPVGSSPAYISSGLGGWLHSDFIKSRFKIGYLNLSNNAENRAIQYLSGSAFSDFIVGTCLGYLETLDRVATKHHVDWRALEHILLWIDMALPIFHEYYCSGVPTKDCINTAFRENPRMAESLERHMKAEYPYTVILGMRDVTSGRGIDGTIVVKCTTDDTSYALALSIDLIKDARPIFIAMNKVGNGLIGYYDMRDAVYCEASLGKMLHHIKDAYDDEFDTEDDDEFDDEFDTE